MVATHVAVCTDAWHQLEAECLLVCTGRCCKWIGSGMFCNTISSPIFAMTVFVPHAGTGGPSQVDKSRQYPPLPSPIRRVFYLSREGTGQEHEVAPPPNPRIITEIERADAIVYGIGSLYTSICPSLILDGVGEAIAAWPTAPKVRTRTRLGACYVMHAGIVVQACHACAAVNA